MLLYDNRGKLRLLCQMYGSIYKRLWQPLLFMTVYSVVLLAVLRSHVSRILLPVMDHPFVLQSFGTLLAFVVCFRTNIAWNRFWESCRETCTMFSKWADSYMQLQGFLNSTIRKREKEGNNVACKELQHARFEITHYFTLLSAMAIERLTRGDIRRMEMRRTLGVPWKDQVAFREDLRAKDLTGSRALIEMRVIEIDSNGNAEAELFQKDSFGSEGRVTRLSQVSRPPGVAHAVPKKRFQLQKAPTFATFDSSQYSEVVADSWTASVTIVGELMSDEVETLRKSKDRVSVVLCWIQEWISCLEPKLVTPAPILSRTYQELSNGGLGYSQAEKLSDIPFPFIFAQLLWVMILIFALVAPVGFTVMTGDSWLTPVISSLVVISFWALNAIAMELENPFGDEANTVPVIDAHERFVEFLVEMHGSVLPRTRQYVKDEPVRRTTRIHRGGLQSVVQPSLVARIAAAATEES